MAYSQYEWEEMKKDVSSMKQSILTLQLESAGEKVEFRHLQEAQRTTTTSVNKLNRRNVQLSAVIMIFTWLASSGMISAENVIRWFNGQNRQGQIESPKETSDAK